MRRLRYSRAVAIGGAALLAWAAWRAGGMGRVLEGSDALIRQRNEFWTIFPGALTASVGYWAMGYCSCGAK